MKSIYMLAALFTFQISSADASEGMAGSTNFSNHRYGVEIPAMLAPVTPSVATFEEGAPPATVNVWSLAPQTPAVAEFEEPQTISANDSSASLAPVTPAEADFEDHN